MFSRVGRAACAVLALLVTSSSCFAQQWAEDMFDVKLVDFGTVARGGAAKGRITVTNKYKETVHISNIERSCGCTQATPSSDTLKTYEKATIDVVLDTVKFQGQKDSAITVNIDQPYPARVRIPVRAFIRTDVVMSPGSINFGQVISGTASQQSVNVSYSGRSNWTITGVEGAGEHLTATVRELNRNGGQVQYELLVTLKPDAPAGDVRTQLTLLTDDAYSPKLPVLVEGTVEKPFSVQPDVVALGVLSPGQTKTINVLIKGKRPFKIEDVASQTVSGLEVRKPDTERATHIVPFSFTAPNDSATLDEVITVKIDGENEPVRFRLTGRITGTTTVGATK